MALACRSSAVSARGDRSDGGSEGARSNSPRWPLASSIVAFGGFR